MLTTKTILSRVLSVSYIATIFLLCMLNLGSEVRPVDTLLGIPFDKIVHFIMFLPYASLAFLSFEHKRKGAWESVKFVLLAMLSGLAVAAATEFIQSFLPHRAMELYDFVADTAAITIGSIFVLAVDLSLLKGKHSKKSK